MVSGLTSARRKCRTTDFAPLASLSPLAEPCHANRRTSWPFTAHRSTAARARRTSSEHALSSYGFADLIREAQREASTWARTTRQAASCGSSSLAIRVRTAVDPGAWQQSARQAHVEFRSRDDRQRARRASWVERGLLLRRPGGRRARQRRRRMEGHLRLGLEGLPAAAARLAALVVTDILESTTREGVERLTVT